MKLEFNYQKKRFLSKAPTAISDHRSFGAFFIERWLSSKCPGSMRKEQV